MTINPQFYKKITSNFQTTTRKIIKIREKLKEEMSSLTPRDKFLMLIAHRIFSLRTTLVRSFLHTMSRPENFRSSTPSSRRLLTNAAVAAPLIKNLPLKLVRILLLPTEFTLITYFQLSGVNEVGYFTDDSKISGSAAIVTSSFMALTVIWLVV